MENNDLKELLGRVVASLSDEQKKEALASETMDEMMAKLGEMGVELPDELLDEVAGGLNLTFRGITTPQPIGSLRPLDFFSKLSGFKAELLDLADTDGVEATHMNIVGSPSLEVTNLGGIPGQFRNARL